MIIVITMAGLGSRFKEAGYLIPKYMIEVNGKTLFEWSLDSLIGYNNYVSKYYFIVRSEDNATRFIKEKAASYYFNNIEIVEIDYLTDGQATTALLASKTWCREEELLIYNIDTYIELGQLNYTDIKGDGFIPCFAGKGNHWSFVRLDENEKAIEVREKIKISDHCTVGAYYFKNCALYEQLYMEFYVKKDRLENGKQEKYVAPLYNLLIQQGGNVNISKIPFEKVHVLGTPAELDNFLKKKSNLL